MPWCCCWRSRPIGPPAPRLGGRRPRRRLCFPPPAEGCPGPAFIFLLIPGLDHRPDCFVFPCSLHAGAAGGTMAIGRAHPNAAGLRSRANLKTVLAPGVCLGAKGQPESVAVGNIMMLLMKWSAAQGGSVSSFAHASTAVSGLCSGSFAVEVPNLPFHLFNRPLKFHTAAPIYEW